jgi:hypothetical protein
MPFNFLLFFRLHGINIPNQKEPVNPGADLPLAAFDLRFRLFSFPLFFLTGIKDTRTDH